MCRNEPENVSYDSDSDDLEEESESESFFDIQERRKARRRILNNIMRRKSLGSNNNIESLRKQIHSKKNILNNSRNQLRIMNKAIAANVMEYRKQEALHRRILHCQLKHLKRVNKEQSKDIYSQAKCLEKKVSTALCTITKLEDKVLGYA